MTKDYLTICDLAQETSESQSVYRKRIRRGEIRVVKLGRNIRVRRTDFERWIRRKMIDR